MRSILSNDLRRRRIRLIQSVQSSPLIMESIHEPGTFGSDPGHFIAEANASIELITALIERQCSQLAAVKMRLQEFQLIYLDSMMRNDQQVSSYSPK